MQRAPPATPRPLLFATWSPYLAPYVYPPGCSPPPPRRLPARRPTHPHTYTHTSSSSSSPLRSSPRRRLAATAAAASSPPTTTPFSSFVPWVTAPLGISSPSLSRPRRHRRPWLAFWPLAPLHSCVLAPDARAPRSQQRQAASCVPWELCAGFGHRQHCKAGRLKLVPGAVCIPPPSVG